VSIFAAGLNDPMSGLMQAAMRSKSKPAVRMDLRAEEARPAARRRDCPAAEAPAVPAAAAARRRRRRRLPAAASALSWLALSQLLPAQTAAQNLWLRSQCVSVTESWPAACGFDATNIARRRQDWTCSSGCARSLLTWTDHCRTCEMIPALNDEWVPNNCHIPEESWEAFSEVVFDCTQVQMELYLQSNLVTGCPTAANACRADRDCANEVAGMFHEYWQSCTHGSCENPNSETMVPLAQAVVTCNCEYIDAPAPQAFAQFVQDCTGPGAPVIIELALGATIAAIPEGSDARAQFEQQLMRDLSTTLMVSSTRIDLLSISAGSLIVKFRVNQDPDGRPPTLATVRATMQQLVGVPIQIAGATVLEQGGVRIISGPVIRAPTGDALGPADEDRTLQQLQQEQMADIQELQLSTESSGALRAWGASTAVAAVLAALLPMWLHC
jgi:hypothetical protein